MKARFLVVALIAATTSLMAQGPGRGFGRESATPPTAAEMAQMKINGLTKFLSLTPTQVTAATGFLTTEETCLATNSANLKTARANLVTAVKAGGASGITSAVNAISPLQADQDICRAIAAAAIYGQLTAAQQAQIEHGLGPLMGGGGLGGFGPRGGR